MNKRCSAVTIFVILLLFVLATPLFSAAVKTITIKGIILDPNCKPITGATVYPLLYPQDTYYAEPTAGVTVYPSRYFHAKPLQTGKDGAFTLSAEQNNQINILIVVAKNYAIGVKHYKNDNSKKVIINLIPDVKRQGRVLDENGKPVPDAIVSIKPTLSPGAYFPIADEIQKMMAVKTKNDGRFVLEHIPNLSFEDTEGMCLIVKKKGKATVTIPFNEAGWIDKDNITLTDECLLNGKINLPGNKYAAPEGTIISVIPDYGKLYATRAAKTDKLGEFHLNGLLSGKYSIRLGVSDDLKYTNSYKYIDIEDSKWVMPAAKIELSQDKPTHIDLVLQNPCIVSGKVVDKVTGKPSRNMTLQIHHAGLPDGEYEDIYADNDDGSFEAKVVPGEVRLKVLDEDINTYDDIEVSALTFDVLEGRNKTDINMNVDFPSRANQIAESASIPQDFEITPGTYKLTWDSDINISDVIDTDSRIKGQQAFAKVKKLPNLVSKNAKCGLFALDGGAYNGYVAVVMDESKGTGRGFDKAYIDYNRNWDLTDDAPVNIKYSDDVPWVSIDSHQGVLSREHSSNPVKMMFYYWTSSKVINSERKGVWKGILDSSKGKVECVIVDRNCNGIYNDPTAWPEKGAPLFTGDVMYVDANGAGKAFVSEGSKQEIQLQKCIQIGGRFYQATVSDSGDSISIKPFTGATAKINITTTIGGKNFTASSAKARGMSGEFTSTTIDKKVQPLKVPCGVYRINECTLSSQVGKKVATLTLKTDIKVSASKEINNVNISGNAFGVINPDAEKLVWTAGKSNSLDWQIKINKDTTLTDSNISIGDPLVKFYNKSGKVVGKAKGGYT